MAKFLLDRRTVLRGAAGALVGLPWLEAHGATTPPRRLVIFFTGEGFPIAEWRPIAGTGPSDFKLSPMLSAFEPIKRQTLLIEGVPMTSSFDARQQAQGHPAGAQAVLTGAWAGVGTSYGGGNGKLAGFSPYPSIDHIIAKATGGATRFPAFYQGVVSGGTTPATRAFVADDAKGISLLDSPRAAFDQLFADFTGASTNELAAAQRRRADERRVVLDAVLGDIKALRCRLGTEDRRRLDAHLTNVSDIQKKVSVPPAVPAVSCSKPARPDAVDTRFLNAEAVTTAQLDLLASALACDRTRVACMSISHADATGAAVYRWLGHDLSHHEISHLQGPNPRERLVQIGTWHAQQLMALIKRLQAVPEGNGTLFDNTAILWVSEVGDGWSHDRKAPVFMIFGTGQGYFKTGRHLKFGAAPGVTHNRLLGHFLAYMGVPGAPVVGPPEYNTGGPLPDITTA